MTVQEFQQRFIDLAIRCQALQFGDFTVKSGRRSPYFFNAGRFSSGAALLELGNCYADAIAASSLDFQLLFEPAYKGIPLVAATATALAARHGRDLPWAFNRKEAKQHGEGGTTVGAPLSGDVLIVDDVITAGTAIREVDRLIRDAGARPVGVIIGLDRRERGRGNLSAIDEVKSELGIEVVSIVNAITIRDYLAGDPKNAMLVSRMDEYRQNYGV